VAQASPILFARDILRLTKGIHAMMHRQLYSTLAALLFATLNVSAQTAALANNLPKRLVADYGYWSRTQTPPYSSDQIPFQKLTHINHSGVSFDASGGLTVPDGFLEPQLLQKAHAQGIPVLLLLGGDFPGLETSTAALPNLIANLKSFIKENAYDGLDIDWEYPGLAGSTQHFRPEDKQNYTRLLKELRTRFDEHEKQLHRPLFLTIATGASPEFLAHTEMDKVQPYVDTVNLMAYDYYEPDSDATTGHHAPLFTNPADPKKISADASVQAYEQAGVPAGKIVLGVPFYGHVWGEVPALNHGLYQPGKKTKNAWLQYGGVDGMLKSGFIRYWDPVAKVPYLYNAEKQTFVSYDDPQSLVLKCRYVLEGKLRGVMFWDYESDPTGTLLDAVDAGLSKNPTTF